MKVSHQQFRISFLSDMLKKFASTSHFRVLFSSNASNTYFVQFKKEKIHITYVKCSKIRNLFLIVRQSIKE